MKILFIGDTYLPVNCGMTSVIKYLAEGLHSRGHNVSVISNSAGRNLPESEIINGVFVYRFDLSRNRLNQVKGETEELRNFVIQCNADVTIFQALGSIPFDALVPVMRRIPGKKILHSHGNTFATLRPFCLSNSLRYSLSSFKAKILLGWQNYFVYPDVIRRMDHVIVLSKLCSDYELMSRYARNLSVIGNAVDKMFFDDNVEVYALPTKHKKYILSIASYYELKNQKLMIDSYGKLKVKGYSLVLIGQSRNNYFDAVRQKADELQAENPDKDVVMLTGVDRKYFPYILHNASLYLVASRKEEFSISLAEAMSCGLPFVSTDVGNARELPGGMIANNDVDLVIDMEKVLSDEPFRNNKSTEVKEYAMANFRQEDAVQKLDDLIIKQVNQPMC